MIESAQWADSMKKGSCSFFKHLLSFLAMINILYSCINPGIMRFLCFFVFSTFQDNFVLFRKVKAAGLKKGNTLPYLSGGKRE